MVPLLEPREAAVQLLLLLQNLPLQGIGLQQPPVPASLFVTEAPWLLRTLVTF